MKIFESIKGILNPGTKLPLLPPEGCFIGHGRHLFYDRNAPEESISQRRDFINGLWESFGKNPSDRVVPFKGGSYCFTAGDLIQLCFQLDGEEVESAFLKLNSPTEWPVYLVEALKWPETNEAIVRASAGGAGIYFFDTGYAKHGLKYRIDKEYRFRFALLAYHLTCNEPLPSGFSPTFRGYMPVGNDDASKDELGCLTIVEGVQDCVFAGERFQVLDVGLAETDYVLRLNAFVPANVYSKSIQVGDRVSIHGWLSGALVED